MSVLVDSSVWINHLRGQVTPSVATLRRLLADDSAHLLTADLVLHEVTRGCRSEREAALVAERLQGLEVVDLCGARAALSAAKLYRSLRAQGVTVAKTVDLFIANWCIHERAALLHDDKDFDAFTRHGLACL